MDHRYSHLDNALLANKDTSVSAQDCVRAG
jgi:hypothetical protein